MVWPGFSGSANALRLMVDAGINAHVDGNNSHFEGKNQVMARPQFQVTEQARKTVKMNRTVRTSTLVSGAGILGRGGVCSVEF